MVPQFPDQISTYTILFVDFTATLPPLVGSLPCSLRTKGLCPLLCLLSRPVVSIKSAVVNGMNHNGYAMDGMMVLQDGGGKRTVCDILVHELACPRRSHMTVCSVFRGMEILILSMVWGF